jgi:UDP-2,3-diacylglucosamine hydrolase
MGDFFANQMGITLYRDELNFEYDSKKFHLIHGDGLSPRDRGYRFLKKILRNKFNVWLYRKLPPEWAYPLARKVSRLSRQHTSQRDSAFQEDYRQYALAKLKSGVDVVIIAHLHLPLFERSDNGIYINSGDFIDHFSYVKVSGGRIALDYLK